MRQLQYSGPGRTLAAVAVGAAALLAGLGLMGPRPARAQGGSGFYRTDVRGGVSWLIAPDGHRALVLGVNHVLLVSASAPRTDLDDAYIDQRSNAIVAALRANGFNTLGGDTDADIWHRGMPYIENLGLSLHLQADQQTPAVDVYASDFVSRLTALVEAACPPRSQDPDLVGYFSDTGLDWDPGGDKGDVLAYYLQLPLSAPGRLRAVDFLRERYGSAIKNLNLAWHVKARDFTYVAAPPGPDAAYRADATAFGTQVLARYLQNAANAVHAADPNHLFLGANLAASDAATADIRAIPDVDSLRVGSSLALPGAGGSGGKPLLIQVSGCAGPANLAAMFANPRLIGYVWNPAGDWQSGACAAEAASAWRAVNGAAMAEHGGAAPKR